MSDTPEEVFSHLKQTIKERVERAKAASHLRGGRKGGNYYHKRRILSRIQDTNKRNDIVRAEQHSIRQGVSAS
jgi:hypothetical protein